jgi:GGDEF domain-containing protein/PAS domain-containing protein
MRHGIGGALLTMLPSLAAAEHLDEGVTAPPVGYFISVTTDWISFFPWGILALVALILFALLGSMVRLFGHSGHKKRGKRHLTLLEDSMNEVIWAADGMLEVTYCSPSVVRLLGVHAESIIGRPVADSFGRMAGTSVVGDGILWAIHTLAAQGKIQHQDGAAGELSQTLKLTISDVKGRMVPVEITLWVVVDAAGALTQVRCVMRAVLETEDHVKSETLMVSSGARAEIKEDFWSRCNHMMRQLTVSHETMAVILIECDTYDTVARRWGAGAAACVMKNLLERAVERSRNGAFAAVLDARRVIVANPYAAINEAAQEAETIRRALALVPVVIGPGQRVNISGSFGVAVTNGREQIAAVIERAEGALQQAQMNGGNMVCLSVAMPPPAMGRDEAMLRKEDQHKVV